MFLHALFVDFITKHIVYGHGIVYLFTHHLVIDSFPKKMFNPFVLPYCKIAKVERVRADCFPRFVCDILSRVGTIWKSLRKAAKR